MKLTVQLFAALKDVAVASQIEVEVPAGATVAALLQAVAVDHPGMARWAPHLRVAVNQEYVMPGAILSEGDEVAFIPPVSGGAAQVAVVAHVIGLDEVVNPVLAAAGGRAGAVCTFLGVVRCNSVDPEGRERRDIEFLDYEAYAPMAEREMAKIAREVEERWDGHCAILHRTGRLAVGEASVAIAVATAHRAASFEACRYAIDELKRVVPVWKREQAQGGTWWVEGLASEA